MDNILAGLIGAALTFAMPTPVMATTLDTSLTTLAEKGNAEAAYHLGMLYHNGIGVQQDRAKALAWFRKSEAGGDPLAAYKVGCYYSGQGEGLVEDDPDLALEHKMVAAKAGYSLAQYDVAVHYLAAKRSAEAIPWLQAAAEQGYPMAHYNLAVVSSRSDSPAFDPVRAYSSFALAKLLSEHRISPAAQASLDQMARTLTPEQRAAADRAIKTFRPNPTALTRRALEGQARAEALVRSG